MNKIRPLIVGVVCVLGCSGRPSPVRPPDVDADDAAAAAVQELDKSGDGQLSKDEWSASAVMAAVAGHYDKNGDGNLDEQEIVAGLEEWQKSAVGARPVPFRISLDGRPLSAATVRLVPAEFLDGAVKPAAGETDDSGAGVLGMASEDMPPNAPKMPLVQPGLYRVEITHATRKVPAKFNTESTIGVEITSTYPGPDGITWKLTSK
jgi:hypothetical protein